MADFDLTKGAKDGQDVTLGADTDPNADAPKAGDENSTDDTTVGAPTEVIVEGRPLEAAPEPEKVESEEVEENFHYPTHLDPMRNLVSTSGYLDDKMRYDAEKVRAKVEDREPDLDNPPPMQSTPLYTERELASTGLLRGQDADVVLPVVRTVTDEDRTERENREATDEANPRDVEASVY
jgi:hypothetical protein